MTKFIHTLTRLRTARDETMPDDYGQPTVGATTTLEVRGLIQPGRSREADDSRSAGAEIADHVIFLPVMDLEPSDALVSSGIRYAITGIRRFLFGGLAHLEVDARRVDGTTVGEGS